MRPTVHGHLSNERRVARRVDDWVCEYQERHKAHPVLKRFRVRGGSTGVTLNAESITDVITRLRGVAAYFHEQQQRVHIEWLWSSDRIWIVQCDEDKPVSGSTPGRIPDDWRITPPTRSTAVLTAALESKTDWAKARCLRIFRDLDLPVAPVHILEDPSVIKQLIAGTVPKKLVSDLQLFLECPIVIRTDAIRTGNGGLFLPRTDPLRNVEDANAFLVRTARSLSHSGIDSSEMCFLVHRLIPARSAAFGYAEPRARHAFVDSLWGSPDGLNYYSHDSFDVDVRENRVRSSRVRCKPKYVDIDETGRWCEHSSGAPWDWRKSILHSHLLQIADATVRIANRVGSAVSVMFFVGVSKKTELPESVSSNS